VATTVTTIELPREATLDAITALLAAENVTTDYVSDHVAFELGAAALDLFHAAFPSEPVFLDEHDDDDRFGPLYAELERRGDELARRLAASALDEDDPREDDGAS
jgi:hypothetical protein